MIILSENFVSKIHNDNNTCCVWVNVIFGAVHHEDPGKLGRLLLRRDHVHTGGHRLRQVGYALVVEGQDEVWTSLQFETNIVRKVKPWRIFGPHVHDAFLAMANLSIHILSHIEGLWPAGPDFFCRYTWNSFYTRSWSFYKRQTSYFYRAFHEFERAKLDYGGLVLSCPAASWIE